MTNEEYAALIENVQTKIAEIIESVATEAKIHKRFVIDSDDAKWAAFLKNPAGKIHAFSVSFAGESSPARRDIPIGCFGSILKFKIFGYYGYDLGSDAANSEKKMRDELAACRLTIEKLYALDLPDTVERHEGFVYDVKNSFLGANRLHIVTVNFQVVLHAISIRP